MTAWLLIITVGTHGFIGGEYQTEQRCKDAAAMQMPHWKETYSGRHVWWRCKYGYDK